MAVAKMRYMSDSLGRAVDFNVILPVDGHVREQNKGKKLRSLYLLHGIHGSSDDWLYYSAVATYARDADIAIIMPSCENSFYQNFTAHGANYSDFVGRELVYITREVFNLSDKREDTYIAGLSMGGYGALINGLKYSDTFSYIGAYSAAVHLNRINEHIGISERIEARRDYYESVFGNLEKIPGSDADYRYLVCKLKEAGKEFPKMYVCCGTEDGLFGVNEDLHDFLTAEGIEHTYETWPGEHNWIFWDEAIKRTVKQLT